MTASSKDREWIQEIDAALKEWCQGDYVLGEQCFFHFCDPQRPLTEASKDAATEGLDLAASEVGGFVVVTQTCDIVRSCSSRPFVEVVPLVEVDDLYEIQRGRRPQYAFIPGVTVRIQAIVSADRTTAKRRPFGSVTSPTSFVAAVNPFSKQLLLAHKF